MESLKLKNTFLHFGLERGQMRDVITLQGLFNANNKILPHDPDRMALSNYQAPCC